MRKILGPFAALVFMAEVIVAAVFGATIFFSTTPWWAWLIVVAVLFSGWAIDRLLYWAMLQKTKKARAELKEVLANQRGAFNQFLAKAERAFSKATEDIPMIPRTSDDEELN